MVCIFPMRNPKICSVILNKFKVMERIEALNKQIEVCKKDIANLRGRISNLSEVLSDLYVDLFYAQNGMGRGQHFMYNGKEYAKVSDGNSVSVKAYPLTKKGEVSSAWNYVFYSDSGKIMPLPMGNDKNDD